MPIYSLNIYEGKDAEKFKKTSEKLFAKKYPHTNIVSVTIPQEGWVSESVKDGSKVIGYLQYMYCYVLAKDGDDGYIKCPDFSFSKDIKTWAKNMVLLTEDGPNGTAPTLFLCPFTTN